MTCERDGHLRLLIVDASTGLYAPSKVQSLIACTVSRRWNGAEHYGTPMIKRQAALKILTKTMVPRAPQPEVKPMGRTARG